MRIYNITLDISTKETILSSQVKLGIKLLPLALGK